MSRNIFALTFLLCIVLQACAQQKPEDVRVSTSRETNTTMQGAGKNASGDGQQKTTRTRSDTNTFGKQKGGFPSPSPALAIDTIPVRTPAAQPARSALASGGKLWL